MTSLANKHGITMARYPEWCKRYGALRRVPIEEIERAITVRGTTAPELRSTPEYAALLRYCIKWQAELIRMYSTSGERSVDRFRETHYHALIIKDGTRIRLFYEYKKQRGRIRGWQEHYVYKNHADLYSEEP